jgi:hypothetical protein
MLIGVVALGLGLMLTGCGDPAREITITSDPPGALVIVSDIEKGRTPVTFPFTWYGDYDIIVRMDGYETLKTHRNIIPRWCDVPPIDLFGRLLPADKRFLHFELTERKEPSVEELIQRAEHLKQRNLEPVKH